MARSTLAERIDLYSSVIASDNVVMLFHLCLLQRIIAEIAVYCWPELCSIIGWRASVTWQLQNSIFIVPFSHGSYYLHTW
jgi:hypothetical protein